MKDKYILAQPKEYIMTLAVFFIYMLICSGCVYDGWVVNAEYTHNYFKDSKVNIEKDNANTHIVTGPVFDLFGMDNLEFRPTIGTELVSVNTEAEPSILINPRLMWYFAPKSFLQFEYDGSFILDNNQQNHFLFVQFEYRFGK